MRAGEPFVLEIVTSRYKEHVGVGEDFPLQLSHRRRPSTPGSAAIR